MRALLSLLYCLHIRGCASFALLCLSVDTRWVPVHIAIFGCTLLVPFFRFDPFRPTEGEVGPASTFSHSSDDGLLQ